MWLGVVILALILAFTEPRNECRDVCEVLDMVYVERDPCTCFDPVTKRLEVFEDPNDD